MDTKTTALEAAHALFLFLALIVMALVGDHLKAAFQYADRILGTRWTSPTMDFLETRLDFMSH